MTEAKIIERLKAAQVASGLSRTEVSLRAGLGKNYFGQMMDGRSPTVEYLIKVCEVLNVSPLEIMTGVPLSRDLQRLLEMSAKAPDGVLDDILSFALRLLEQQQRGDPQRD